MIRNSTKKLKLFYAFLRSKKLIKKPQLTDEKLIGSSSSSCNIIIMLSIVLFIISIYYLKLFPRLFSSIATKILNSFIIQALKSFISTFHEAPSLASEFLLSTSSSSNLSFFDNIELESWFNFIDYINGLTNIWLQSTSKADKLILSLPVLICCECIENENSNNEGMFYSCNCGKNDEKLKISGLAIQKIRQNECSICLENFERSHLVSQLPCRHNFHKNCIYNWFLTGNFQCPICRHFALCKLNFKNII